MRRRLLLFVACVLLAAAAGARAERYPQAAHRASPADAGPLRVEGAVDGILGAFRHHPLVGMSDRHNLAELGALYAALVRDPRFGREVGNVVVEFGGAASQETIDRYLAGEAVPYEELRRVWTDVVGWEPGEIGQMYLDVFAAVRLANANLPPEQRIRVWLGEPKIDWSQVTTEADLAGAMSQRNAHPTELITREILGRGKKALVIYGGAHFFSRPPFPTSIKAGVEQQHPGAFYIVAVYAGLATPACDKAFEAKARTWGEPALVSPIAGTWIEAALRDPACTVRPPVMIAPAGRAAPPPPTPEQQARRAELTSGVLSDAILYLGPAATLTATPQAQDLYLDEDFRREMSRRNAILTGKPLSAGESLDANTRAARPYRD